jgi:hypothetical protein
VAAAAGHLERPAWGAALCWRAPCSRASAGELRCMFCKVAISDVVQGNSRACEGEGEDAGNFFLTKDAGIIISSKKLHT